jgi:hypothetical protein
MSGFNLQDYPFHLESTYVRYSEQFLQERWCHFLNVQQFLEVPMLISALEDGFEFRFQTESDLRNFRRVALPDKAGNPCPVDPCIN